MTFDLESTRAKLLRSNSEDLMVEGLEEVRTAGKSAVPLIREVVGCLDSFFLMSSQFGEDVKNTEMAAHVVGGLLPEADLTPEDIETLSLVSHASKTMRSFINASEMARAALKKKGLVPLPPPARKPKPGASDRLADLRSAMKAKKLTRREPKLLYLVAKKLEPAHVVGHEGLFEEMQSALASLLVHEPSKKRHSPGSLLADELLRLAAALLPHPAADRAVFERYLEGAESPTRKARALTCVKKIASV